MRRRGGEEGGDESDGERGKEREITHKKENERKIGISLIAQTSSPQRPHQPRGLKNK